MGGREFKHTDAAEMDRFLAKPQSAQLLEIWLNGRETNGSVAEVRRDLATVERTAQKTAVAVSDHLGQHQREQAGIDFIKRWGAIGTGILLVMFSGIGAWESITHIFGG